MAQFHTPRQQPYNPFRPIGAPNVKSRYIPNQYFVEFTPSWWRNAIDNAVNYSDLTMVDTLYSWCIQSSPFLVSQMNKRLNPIENAVFAFYRDGEIDENLTEMITRTRWFNKMKREFVLSKFYGVRIVGIDVEKDTITSYPLRNIDMVNRAIRSQTYAIESVANVDDYDNMFYMQPDTDQDFKMGMMQQISRAMIGIVEAYNNWSVTSATYSYPRTTVGFIDGNAQAQALAENIANNLDPLDTPVLPFKQNLDNKENVYQVEVKPLQTQMYPDAFRVFKEYIDSYRAEIMQEVTGGTLLGATEKNTNSEQLAQIHMSLYEALCNADKRDFANFINYEGAIQKIGRLLGIDMSGVKLREVPDTTISVDKFERIGRVLASQGMAYSPEVMRKVGMEPSDINTSVRNNNWTEVKLQAKSIMAKIKSALTPSKKTNDNGDDSRPEEEN
jgi:hypothetical protein